MFHSFLFHRDFSVSPTALIFPPVTSRSRFLIHRTIDEHFPELSSLSVGKEPFRRTLVTWSEFVQKNHSEKDQPTASASKQGEEIDDKAPLDLNSTSAESVKDHSNIKKTGPGPSPDPPQKRQVVSEPASIGAAGPNNPPVTQCPSIGVAQDQACKDGIGVEYPDSAEKSEHSYIGKAILPCDCDSAEGLSNSDSCVNLSHIESYKTGCCGGVGGENSAVQTRPKTKQEPTSHSKGKSVVSSLNNRVKESREVNTGPSTSKKDSQHTEKDTSLRVNSEGNHSPEDSSAREQRTSSSKPSMSPGAMVVEPDSNYGRRRVAREGARIYRPPAARNSNVPDSPANGPPNNYHAQFINMQQERWKQQQQYLQNLKNYQQSLSQRQENHQSTVSSNLNQPNYSSNQNDATGRPKSKRPDQQFYVPRRRRQDDSTGLQDEDMPPRPPSPANSICSIVSEFSGRNRYNRRNNRMPQYGEEQIYAKPPMTSNRETNGDKGRNKSIFSRDTLQLIERCINQDSDNRPCNSPLSYDSYASNPPSPIHSRNDGRSEYYKGIHNSKDFHPVHSKENLMHPMESTPKHRKGKKNRRRQQKSRDPSVESRRGSSRRSSFCSIDSSGPYSYGFSSDRYEYGYDRTPSCASSCTTSRAPSMERLAPYDMEGNWRMQGSSLPASPIKQKPESQLVQRRHSTGRKSPPCRTNTLPVHTNNLDNTCEPPPIIRDTPVNLSLNATEDNDNGSLNLEGSLTSASDGSPCSTDEQGANDGSTLTQLQAEQSIDTSASSHCEDESHLKLNLEVRPNESQIADLILKDSSEVSTRDFSDSSEVLDSSIAEPTSPILVSKDEGIDCDDGAGNSSSDDASNPKKFSFNWADEVEQADEDSWDSLYDDSGNCLDPSLLRQIDDKIGKLKLEKAISDYSDFKPEEPTISDEEYGHVIEIYDFPSTFKTQDLMTIFQSYQDLDIKWVDDTHALGIFTTSLAASQVLSCGHPFVKTRPLSTATHASKAKALRITEMLLPYKPRPQTSAALARRLVSGALGLKVNISREVREAERRKLKNAKEKRRLIAKQKEDAWEGNIANLV